MKKEKTKDRIVKLIQKVIQALERRSRASPVNKWLIALYKFYLIPFPHGLFEHEKLGDLFEMLIEYDEFMYRLCAGYRDTGNIDWNIVKINTDIDQEILDLEYLALCDSDKDHLGRFKEYKISIDNILHLLLEVRKRC